jgi:hypothetical protein
MASKLDEFGAVLGPKFVSGQVFVQRRFPYMRRRVILGGPDGSDRSCFILIDGDPPIVCTDADGKWMYSEGELEEKFARLGYVLEDVSGI